MAVRRALEGSFEEVSKMEWRGTLLLFVQQCKLKFCLDFDPRFCSQVRKAYLKAMLVVHPDKLPHGVGPDRLARANLIFTALRAAFALNSK